MPQQKILLVSRNLPPLVGGMERLNLHIVQALASHADVTVVGPAGCADSLPRGVRASETRSSRLGRFLLGAFWRATRAALRERFDWLLAGSGLTAPIVWFAARVRGGRCAVYLHGLDIVVPHRVYRWLWLPLIRRMDLCLTNSLNTARLAEQAGVPAARIRILHPGVDMVTTPPREAAVAWRDRQGLAGRKVMLSVGRLTRRKGLLEFVERTLPTVVAEHPDAALVVIGNEAPDALAGSALGISREIHRAAERLGLSENLRLLGACDQAELEAAYAAADVLVFPVKEVKGDVEGFGMVALEAAAHGLPTVAFGAGGVPDAVSHGMSGWLVSPGDHQAFATYLVQVISGGASTINAGTCRSVAEKFAWPVFDKQLRHLLALSSTASGMESGQEEVSGS